MTSFTVTGQLVDIPQQKIYPAMVVVQDGKIKSIETLTSLPGDKQGYILPGFIDSHVHIESSMLVPAEFARLAVVHGTVGTISDPHEIANVCGVAGVDFMIDNGNTVNFKFNFGAPSCVPATTFETAGATIDAVAVKQLLARDEIKYLSEMMNFPGVLHGDAEVMAKIKAAQELGKPVDGHAPGLRGDTARQYIAAGISTDHECFTADEAMDKLQHGMKILIREGSAAKNFDALIPLMHDHADNMMFCSDDKHPDSLMLGHINELCARAVAKGIDVFKVLKAACINPVKHYKMDVGLLQPGDDADFIVVENLEHFKVLQTYINGELVANGNQSLINTGSPATVKPINNFNCRPKTVDDISRVYRVKEDTTAPADIPVIEALDGQLITNKILLPPVILNGQYVSDTDRDMLKIVVVNRYNEATVTGAFIKNFGLKNGAIASSVAHDSHNIVAVGVDDESLVKAINMVIAQQGGISLYVPATGNTAAITMEVPLPVAGLMSIRDGYEVGHQYAAIDKAAKAAGSTLTSPFMTLSFMALLVIPHIKLSDLGLFDGDSFSFITA
ncbi:adenine deaminase [Terrimonas rubra]|uniref:Adenine deaminase n=1 Tax=Terrimonas rubra TaxID=1035890 RepID=A0ABW6A4S5_9BACT